MTRLVLAVITSAILFTILSCNTVSAPAAVDATPVPAAIKDIKTFLENVDSDADMELGVEFLLTDNQSRALRADGKITYVFLYSAPWSEQKVTIFKYKRQIIGTQSDLPLNLPIYYKKADFKIPCDKCMGTGYEICSSCNGAGAIICNSCNGAGKSNNYCLDCNGKANVDLSKYKRITGFSNPTGCPAADYYMRTNLFPEGATTTPCPSCNGSGKQACSTCKGSGKVSCPRCNGSQKIKCTNTECRDGFVNSSGQTCALVIEYQLDNGVIIEGRSDSVVLP